MNRGTLVLVLVSLLLMSACLVYPQAKPPAGPEYLTVQDVEKITGLHGLKIVPPDPSKGAGSDLNFADPDGNLVVMVQRRLSSDMLYTQTQKMNGVVKAEIAGVGDAAFSGPARDPQYFISFKKGKGSGSVATFFGAKGTRLTLDQVKQIAQLIASGM
ncbi:MAG: hypothetical protein WBN92_14120 [Terriglobia bacterium]